MLTLVSFSLLKLRKLSQHGMDGYTIRMMIHLNKKILSTHSIEPSVLRYSRQIIQSYPTKTRDICLIKIGLKILKKEELECTKNGNHQQVKKIVWVRKYLLRNQRMMDLHIRNLSDSICSQITPNNIFKPCELISLSSSVHSSQLEIREIGPWHIKFHSLK